jgi:hypothetical protein
MTILNGHSFQKLTVIIEYNLISLASFEKKRSHKSIKNI